MDSLPNLSKNKLINLLSLLKIVCLTNEIHILRLCHQFLASETFDFQVCPSHEETTMITLTSKDHVTLYEYKDEYIAKCIFKNVQNITINNLINLVCFESGNVHYLATSGSISNLFKLNNNHFFRDESMTEIFNGNDIYKMKII